MAWFFTALLVAILLIIVLRRTVKRITVFEYERGLLYTRGRFQQVLEPGAYWSFTPQTTIVKLDLRPRTVAINGQEVLSADQVGLKVSLSAKYQIVDPRSAAHSSISFEAALYLELQLALRELVGAFKIDELLAQRQTLNAQLLERTAPPIRALGLELLAVSVKDIMFPGDLKQIFAQVVKAQKEGLAALEKARGETAALRNLANAAKMLEHNPALMQLRLLQAIGTSSGNTIVVSMPPQATPPTPPQRDDQRPAADDPTS